jgi:GT2 family glycosyltransferase
MTDVDLTISIVTYNSKNVIGNCIDSVLNSTQGLTYEIIVVDNNSEDGTAALIKKTFPDIVLIENLTNTGFGSAQNQSFRISKGRYFLMLNPDTVLFPDTLRIMVNFMDEHPDAGISGPRIFWDEGLHFLFPDLKIHTLLTALFHFTNFSLYFPDSFLSKKYWKSALRIWTADTPIEVEGLTGGMMLARKEAFPLFDEKYFLFFEEHDLFRLAKKQGWKLYYIPGASILHYFEESCRNSSLDIESISLQSARYFYRKYYGYAGVWWLKALVKFNGYLEKHCKSPPLEVISPDNDMQFRLLWQTAKGAVSYLVEVSYNPNFVDRGGAIIQGNEFTLSASVLDRLPSRKGYLRVLPLDAEGSPGKAIRFVQIQD